ncbi:hypothetical protein CAEBREN_07110 [Caenorhabditis brenneri]|uniref:DUF3456 domain-containing protein n=1 Tax=Caenorhabditis brenneri TaxID=135651 RepID=G0N215_CAEBE|nr:hypothetical protein CAEBREN_07110 [Caenorhabditis brenneri]
MPSKCEVCALVSIEFDKLASRVHKRVSSEFADITEKVCEGFNEYKIHKEKTGVERFSRESSKTIATLEQLREKGVRVELGMPYEMWNMPSAEVHALRQGCESLLEDYEEVIEYWFLKKTGSADLFKKLCVQNALINGDTSCFGTKQPDKEL